MSSIFNLARNISIIKPGSLCCIMVLAVLTVSCGTGMKSIKPAGNGEAPRNELYVSGMNGVENLAFDGNGFLYATGLDGMVYKIEPTDDPYRGKIAAGRKIAGMCGGIDCRSDGSVYVAVLDDDNRRIAKISGDLSQIEFLSGHIPGLNGLTLDKSGAIYYTTSNENPFWPSGKILKADPSNPWSFAGPEIIVDGAGLVNGVTLSSDESILYYTETTGGVWAFDMKTGEKKELYSPPGFFQIVDDLAAAPDGSVWICLNSEMIIVHLINGKAGAAYRTDAMGAPSACEFGKGRGFRSDFLYVTEFGLKGRSFTMNGRGIWVLPVGKMRGE